MKKMIILTLLLLLIGQSLTQDITKDTKGEIEASGTKNEVGAPGMKGEMGLPDTEREISVPDTKGEIGVPIMEEIDGSGMEEEIYVPGMEGEIDVRGPTKEFGQKGQIDLNDRKGEVGIPDMKGEMGVPGQKGEKGVPGMKGEIGVLGMKGEKGVPGIKGEIGVPGVKGDIGSPGMKGEMGVQGTKGEMGVRGPKGDSGQKGEISLRGVPGSPGIQRYLGFLGNPENLRELIQQMVKKEIDSIKYKGINNESESMSSGRDLLDEEQYFNLIKNSTEVNGCLYNPCAHFCVNTDQGYNCTCLQGYQLMQDHLCIDVNECLDSPCLPQEECINTEGSYTCKIIYQSESFENICTHPSANCQQSCTKHSIDGATKVECSCSDGFKKDPRFPTQCLDVDECSQYLPCDHICVNTIGSFQCRCRTGFTLTNQRRCEDIDECTLDNACPYQFDCINSLGSFYCIKEDIVNQKNKKVKIGGSNDGTNSETDSNLNTLLLYITIGVCTLTTFATICLVVYVCTHKENRHDSDDGIRIKPFLHNQSHTPSTIGPVRSAYVGTPTDVEPPRSIPQKPRVQRRVHPTISESPKEQKGVHPGGGESPRAQEGTNSQMREDTYIDVERPRIIPQKPPRVQKSVHPRKGESLREQKRVHPGRGESPERRKGHPR